MPSKIDTTKLTNKELADQLNKSTTLNIYKQEASKRLLQFQTTGQTEQLNNQSQAPILTQKQIDEYIKQQKEMDKKRELEAKQKDLEARTCQYISVCCPFELKESQKLQEPFYPSLVSIIKMDSEFEAITGKMVKLEVEEVMRITEKQLTIDNIEDYIKHNPQLDNSIVYYPKQKVYASQNVKDKVLSIPDLRYNTLEERQKKLSEWLKQAGNQEIKMVIDDTYNPTIVTVKTGKTKEFTTVLTGSVVTINNIKIAQSIIKL